MIGYLTGTVIDTRDQSLILLVGGVGYEVFTPKHVLDSVPVRTDTSLWIATIVRETSLELFGFLTGDEYELFKKLIGISGVGPRSALNILDIAPIENLVSAIRSNDASLLTKVSGIGKKTAEKIVLELHDKIDHIHTEISATRGGDSDVLDALISLGYNQMQAREALAHLSDELTEVNDRIREALRFLA